MDWNNINTDRDTSGLGPIEYDQTKVPALIRKHADNVRTKTYGQEVREAQARNAEVAGLIASEAVDISNETKGRQDTVETQFNSVQQEMTNKDVISAPEIIVARGGLPQLVDRLDATDAQLAHTILLSSDFGLIGDGTDETVKFQNMLNESTGKKIKILKPKTKYKIGQIHIPSNTNLLIEEDSIFEITSGLSENEKWINLMDRSNITISSENGYVVFRMMKDEYTTGEQRHCFNMDNTHNVLLKGIIAKDSGGDGFYIGNARVPYPDPCTNIKMINCIAENNRRQGLSITGADGFVAENCSFNNSNGTNPQCGVDIEPNFYFNTIRSIRFVDCEANDNAGRGFDIMLKNQDHRSNFVDIEFINCRTKNNAFGFQPKYFNQGARGIVKIIDCISEEEKLNAVNSLSCHSDSIKVVVKNHVAINCNTNNDTAAHLSFASSYLVNEFPSEPRDRIGNIDFINCVSFDTRETSLIRRGLATVKNHIAIPERVSFIDCESYGHTVSGFEIDVATEDLIFRNERKEELYRQSSGNLQTRYMNRIHTNRGAASIVSLTLPNPRRGFLFSFRVESGNTLKINPQPDSQILALTSGAGKSIESNLVGSYIELHGRNDGHWEVIRTIGKWDESAP